MGTTKYAFYRPIARSSFSKPMKKMFDIRRICTKHKPFLFTSFLRKKNFFKLRNKAFLEEYNLNPPVLCKERLKNSLAYCVKVIFICIMF